MLAIAPDERSRLRELMEEGMSADLLLLSGAFTYVKADAPPLLTLVPPSMIGPPEFVHIDMKDTDTPAIVTRQIGKGTVTWIPWDLDGLYYRLSLPAHAAAFRDAMDGLNPRRQIKTDAHPLVEMTLMRQGSRTILHLINLSGHSQTGYFDPIPMPPIHVRVAGAFTKAMALRTPGKITTKIMNPYTEFTIPRLIDYEAVALE